MSDGPTDTRPPALVLLAWTVLGWGVVLWRVGVCVGLARSGRLTGGDVLQVGLVYLFAVAAHFLGVLGRGGRPQWANLLAFSPRAWREVWDGSSTRTRSAVDHGASTDSRDSDHRGSGNGGARHGGSG